MNSRKNEPVTWVEVDTNAIRHNIREIKRQTKGLPLMPIVKANAYGHGMVPVAKICEAMNVEYLGVISCKEAFELRQQGIKLPIAVLSYVGTFLPKDDVVRAIKLKIEFSLFDIETAHFLSNMARRAKVKVRVHLKVDTGTNRLGVPAKDFLAFFRQAQKLPYLEIVGIMTHFARAEETDTRPTMRQAGILQKLQREISKIHKKDIRFHAACSAVLLSHNKIRFDLGRLGLALYGLWPSTSVEKRTKDVYLKPALAWKTKVIQVKNVKKGGAIGYGGTYIAPRDIIIAVLSLGYADGYDRKISNRGYVLIHGKRAPIRGRICMNLMMVEVTDIPKTHQGSKVTLIGTDGNETITVENIARWADTINYEVITRINWSLPRFYL